ncbi:MAG: hypothetical protein ACI9VR_004883 [Cognaticolwellia sp.]|jgi:hypothetical protein
MNNTLTAVGAIATAMTLVGCYKNTISTGLPGGGPVHEQEVQFLLWGLVGESTIDTKELCPSGVSRIEEYKGPRQLGMACVTCGVYAPIQVNITCTAGQSWRMQTNSVTGLSVVSLETEQLPVQRGTK